MKRKITNLLIAAFAFAGPASLLLADETATKVAKPVSTESKKASKKTSKDVQARSVEMFQAMEDGLLTVDYIGKDATEANLIFRNQTAEPLDIVLPNTFGAVPVNAQMGGGMGGMGGGGMGGMGGMCVCSPISLRR
jgi:hypothetical protein